MAREREPDWQPISALDANLGEAAHAALREEATSEGFLQVRTTATLPAVVDIPSGTVEAWWPGRAQGFAGQVLSRRQQSAVYDSVS